MTKSMAAVLAESLGGIVEHLMPQSRAPGVRLVLPGGKVALVDELGGATFLSQESLREYADDGDERRHIVASAEWEAWGVREEWATGLARLIGGRAFQSGGNIWVVLFERADGGFVVVGDDGVDLYDSAEHYERYYETDGPEPRFASWTSESPTKG